MLCGRVGAGGSSRATSTEADDLTQQNDTLHFDLFVHEAVDDGRDRDRDDKEHGEHDVHVRIETVVLVDEADYSIRQITYFLID